MIDLSNITFTTGNYEDNILKIEALCEAWHEDRKYVKEFKVNYNPDRTYFNLLNRSGNLVTVCIFDGDLLVGTYMGYRSKCMQDKDLTLVHCLMWCIRKEYRSGMIIVNLFKYLDKYMKTNNIHQYSLCLDDLPEYTKLESYLTGEVNPRPFTKIESYYYRDLREE